MLKSVNEYYDGLDDLSPESGNLHSARTSSALTHGRIMTISLDAHSPFYGPLTQPTRLLWCWVQPSHEPITQSSIIKLSNMETIQ